ncbi:MAG TPA: hypothetical protein VK550_31065 [Polyangiaceae bacterium]|nr:hypothetical protein [Polyangiaceae bacterium]
MRRTRSFPRPSGPVKAGLQHTRYAEARRPRDPDRDEPVFDEPVFDEPVFDEPVRDAPRDPAGDDFLVDFDELLARVDSPRAGLGGDSRVPGELTSGERLVVLAAPRAGCPSASKRSSRS